jgi:hypothetical protein
VADTSVARWHIFKPNILISVNFGRSCNERCWYLYYNFDNFTVQLVHIFSRFGMLYLENSGNPGRYFIFHTKRTIMDKSKLEKTEWRDLSICRILPKLASSSIAIGNSSDERRLRRLLRNSGRLR